MAAANFIKEGKLTMFLKFVSSYICLDVRPPPKEITDERLFVNHMDETKRFATDPDVQVRETLLSFMAGLTCITKITSEGQKTLGIDLIKDTFHFESLCGLVYEYIQFPLNSNTHHPCLVVYACQLLHSLSQNPETLKSLLALYPKTPCLVAH